MNENYEDIDDDEEERAEIPSKCSGRKKASSFNQRLKNIIEANLVVISDDLSISRYLVTQNLYEKVMGKNPSRFMDEVNSEEWEGLPVENVSFDEALAFCAKLSELCGYNKKNCFRLPTEREWNYVANGASKKPEKMYAGSNNPNGVAWYRGNSDSTTHAVGKMRGLEVGSGTVFDLSGNVWEWCQPDDGSDKAVCYGGSYYDDKEFLRLGEDQARQIFEREYRNSMVGFRICVNFYK